MIRYQNILVPVDFSAPSEAALAHAAGLAGQSGGRLHLLHVVTEPFLFDAWGREALPTRRSRVMAQLLEGAREQLRQLAAALALTGRKPAVATAMGTIADEILKYARTHHIDLIVIGAEGRGAVGKLFLGSTADRVLRRSPVPVLAVRRARPGESSRREVFSPRRAKARALPSGRHAGRRIPA